MKAVQLLKFGIDNLQQADMPVPAPQPGEIRVKTEAVSLNYLDLMVAEGNYFPDLSFPFIPVCDGAGIVDALGEGVTKWKKGDRVTLHYLQLWQAGKLTEPMRKVRAGVFMNGLLAEYVCFPESSWISTPKNLTTAEAATLPIAGLTAWSGLIELAKLKPGQTVVIEGTGGVSLFALQIAKWAGAKVIALSGTDAKLEKLKALGADVVINYKTFPQWHQEVKKNNGGKGVDVILDVAGGESLAQALKSIKLHGFIGLVGIVESVYTHFNVMDAVLMAARLEALAVGSKENFERFANAIENNNLKPVIDTVFSIDEVQQAYRHLKSGKHFGKIVITL